MKPSLGFTVFNGVSQEEVCFQTIDQCILTHIKTEEVSVQYAADVDSAISPDYSLVLRINIVI